jgi:predicted nucleic acid-binding protein
MLVVSDATPLQALVRLGHVQVLPALYEQIVIPPAVASELSHRNTPTEVRVWLATKPPWLSITAPAHVSPTLASGAGEREAISLAMELHADYLLVDDKEARTVARSLGLQITGTIGILELAAAKNLILIRPAIQKLRETGFFIDEDIIAKVLNRAPPP